MLGYAFIQFSSFFEAKKAIDAVNGTEVKGEKLMVMGFRRMFIDRKSDCCRLVSTARQV